MQAPSAAFYRMRASYAGWFWKAPAGVLLTAAAALLLSGQRKRSLPGVLTLAAGIALLVDAARERSVYEVNRAVYDAEVE